LKEKGRLTLFENRVLRRIFGPKRDEVTGEWRKLRNEELSDIYPYPNIVQMIKSRRMRWADNAESMLERKGVYRVLVEKLDGKRPLGRPRCRWKDNITEDFQEVGRRGIDWIDLAHDRDRWRALVNVVMNFRVP